MLIKRETYTVLKAPFPNISSYCRKKRKTIIIHKHRFNYINKNSKSMKKSKAYPCITQSWIFLYNTNIINFRIHKNAKDKKIPLTKIKERNRTIIEVNTIEWEYEERCGFQKKLRKQLNKDRMPNEIGDGIDIRRKTYWRIAWWN